MATLKVIKKK